MANEADVRSRVSKLLREHGFMVQPIETSAMAEGVPDLWYSLSHDTKGWIELKKVREMPKRAETAVFRSMNHPLSIEQENWITCALEHGTRVDILVAYDRDYFLIPGGMAPLFNTFTERDLRHYQVPKAQLVDKLLRP